MPTITGSWSPETTFRPGAQVGATGQGGHTVLLDYAGGQYYGLDEVGTRIWELVRDGNSLGAIVDRLADEYDAPRDVLQADASALLAELAARRLVRAEG
ncbi:MAG TPA: PqqD family protein [Longimicrobium sp.]|nr:PqqD family protein [Longimicrobium sp.]